MFDIYDLFKADENEEILWSLHTTMNYDPTYQVALIKMQESSARDWKEILSTDRYKIAFFYNKNSEPSVKRSVSKDIPLSEIRKYQHPLSNERQTFHTKISLVCINNKENGFKKYRLAVYSKNHTFESDCVESAILLDIKIHGDGDDFHNSKNNGIQFQNFLKHVYESTEEQGKRWLETNLLNPENGSIKAGEVFQSFTNISLLLKEFGNKPASIYFGGCSTKDKTLGEYMEFNTIDLSESVILTPPEFIRGTLAEDYFTKYRILYDIDIEKENNRFNSSHIKLYLLKKASKDDETRSIYELWLGSANATNRGIGWDFHNNCSTKNAGSYISPSVECLVRIEIDEGTFRIIKDEILKYYKVFDFGDVGSLVKTEDILGPLFKEAFYVSGVKYLDGEGNGTTAYKTKACMVRYTFEISDVSKYEKLKDIFENKSVNLNRFEFFPVEYGGAHKISNLSNIVSESSFFLDYGFKKFQPSQKMLSIGTSGVVMYIEDSAMDKEIPTSDREVSILYENYMDQLLECTDGDSLRHRADEIKASLDSNIKYFQENQKQYEECKKKVDWICNALCGSD